MTSEQQFEQMYAILVPIVSDCMRKKTLLPADSILIIHNLVRIACKDECKNIILQKREERRKFLKEKKFNKYVKASIRKLLIIRSIINQC